MALRVRRNGSLVVTVRLTLRPGRDDDLILLLENAPRGALAGLVREAMRSGVASSACIYQDASEEQPLDMSALGMDI